ncbi:hypothetical protein GCM10009872_53960 [Actinopolymorpha rutila]
MHALILNAPSEDHLVHLGAGIVENAYADRGTAVFDELRRLPVDPQVIQQIIDSVDLSC